MLPAEQSWPHDAPLELKLPLLHVAVMLPV
jgi:hypothetical protein